MYYVRYNPSMRVLTMGVDIVYRVYPMSGDVLIR